MGHRSQEPRCPSCGGLVTSDADWCGQCYAPLRGAGAEPQPQGEDRPAVAPEAGGPDAEPSRGEALTRRTAVATPGGGHVEVAEGTAAWDCPVCGDRNAIEASVCSTCQTPFARLFEEPVRREEIEPKTAALWSLAFPGLGHWKGGARPDAIARIVLFAWTIGTVLIMLLSRPAGGGFGTAFPLFALYLGSSMALYAESALDAHRAASGHDPLVSSRTLMWAAAALVLGSVVLATFVTLPAARQ